MPSGIQPVARLDVRHVARLVLVGGPRTGKSTYARKLGTEHGAAVRHTDDLMHLQDWSLESAAAADWFDLPGPWVVEGVTTARALRKWLARNPKGAPCDAVALMWTPVVPTLLPGQVSMAKGVRTVWSEIEPQLHARGVRVEAI